MVIHWRAPLRRPGVNQARPRPVPSTTLLLATAATYVAAGGFVHLREWLDTYRHVPAEAAGSAVVRVGFPLNTATSLIVAGALAFCAWKHSQFARYVVAGAVLFQAASLGALIATRTGSLFGWSEPAWTLGANQTLAVEVGAVLSLAAVAITGAIQRRETTSAESMLPALGTS